MLYISTCSVHFGAMINVSHVLEFFVTVLMTSLPPCSAEAARRRFGQPPPAHEPMDAHPSHVSPAAANIDSLVTMTTRHICQRMTNPRQPITGENRVFTILMYCTCTLLNLLNHMYMYVLHCTCTLYFTLSPLASVLKAVI